MRPVEVEDGISICIRMRRSAGTAGHHLIAGRNMHVDLGCETLRAITDHRKPIRTIEKVAYRLPNRSQPRHPNGRRIGHSAIGKRPRNIAARDEGTGRGDGNLAARPLCAKIFAGTIGHAVKVQRWVQLEINCRQVLRGRELHPRLRGEGNDAPDRDSNQSSSPEFERQSSPLLVARIVRSRLADRNPQRSTAILWRETQSRFPLSRQGSHPGISAVFGSVVTAEGSISPRSRNPQPMRRHGRWP